jgi:hypothetical protein
MGNGFLSPKLQKRDAAVTVVTSLKLWGLGKLRKGVCLSNLDMVVYSVFFQ